MEEGRITSRQNRLVRDAAALAEDTSLRRETGRFLCEGARLCQDAARSGLAVETCFFTVKAKEKYGAYLKDILAVCSAAYEVEEHVAALLSTTKNPQGVFCVCRRPERRAEENAPRDNCLVLENLQDPGNLGTVLRTAEALGLDRVILLGECCDPFSPKALRAGMGAAFRLEIIETADAEELCKLLTGQGYLLHAAVPDSEARPLTEIGFSRGLHAVFIGNEGNGLTEEAIAICHDRVTIPMGGRAESLNVSAAATILLWEMCRGEGGQAHG